MKPIEIMLNVRPRNLDPVEVPMNQPLRILNGCPYCNDAINVIPDHWEEREEDSGRYKLLGSMYCEHDFTEQAHDYAMSYEYWHPRAQSILEYVNEHFVFIEANVQ